MNPREKGEVSEVYFAGFVFCSTERFVFGDQGLTGAQSALLSGLLSRLVLVLDALALGFRPTAEPEPCSCSLLRSGGKTVLWTPSQKIISVHCKLSNPVTSTVKTHEQPMLIPIFNFKSTKMITSCYRFMFLPRVRVPKILLGKKLKMGQSKFLKSTFLQALMEIWNRVCTFYNRCVDMSWMHCGWKSEIREYQHMLFEELMIVRVCPQHVSWMHSILIYFCYYLNDSGGC